MATRRTVKGRGADQSRAQLARVASGTKRKASKGTKASSSGSGP